MSSAQPTRHSQILNQGVDFARIHSDAVAVTEITYKYTDNACKNACAVGKNMSKQQRGYVIGCNHWIDLCRTFLV